VQWAQGFKMRFSFGAGRSILRTHYNTTHLIAWMGPRQKHISTALYHMKRKHNNFPKVLFEKAGIGEHTTFIRELDYVKFHMLFAKCDIMVPMIDPLDCPLYYDFPHPVGVKNQTATVHYHPSSEGVLLKEAGLSTIEEYIQKRRDTVETFAQFRPLYEACKDSTPLRNHAVWWKQVHFSQNDENVHD
jgi:hypothetical protein